MFRLRWAIWKHTVWNVPKNVVFRWILITDDFLAYYNVQWNIRCFDLHNKEIRCIDRESNPDHVRGRRAFYHWTINAFLQRKGGCENEITTIFAPNRFDLNGVADWPPRALTGICVIIVSIYHILYWSILQWALSCLGIRECPKLLEILFIYIPREGYVIPEVSPIISII